ncbi:MAG: hypothetical protein ACI915_004556 [Gammaproteobacteria bacterium]
MIHGSCLCRTVSWHYSGAFDQLTHCHCSMCRKAHGTPFASYLIGSAAHFGFESGEQSIRLFESSPGFIRSFCLTCGSVLPNNHLGDIVAIPAGSVDSNFDVERNAHIFTRWKAPWHKITDALPQHDHYPDAPEPAVQRENLSPKHEGLLRGSCLCGDVAFELTDDFSAVYNCHCSRCRKACAAAHATNGVTPISNVKFVKGEATTRSYKPEDARYFTQVFCERCGSALPTMYTAGQIAVVPFGSLDDNPSRSADGHLFVGSKPSWYPITDNLPQFPSGPTAK